jgi:hypothetical protein
MTNEHEVVALFCRMAFFGNMMLAPCTVTPSQGPEGKHFIFFGTIPQEVVLQSPVTIASTMVAPAPLTSSTFSLIEEGEKEGFALTQEGIDNGIMNSPPSSPRRRRRATRKAAQLMASPGSNVLRKRVLDAYQHQLVARPAVPVSNSFTPLRIVAKNSTTGQLRRAWEVPRPEPQRSTAPSNQRRSQAPAETIYKVHRALKERKHFCNKGRKYQVQDQILSQAPAKPRATAPVLAEINPKWFDYETRAEDGTSRQDSVFNRLGQESVFSRLGPKVQPNNLGVTTSDQRRKKRRTFQGQEEHFSCYTISVTFEPGEPIEVNMAHTDDQSSPIQTNVTNTNRKGRSSKKIDAESSKVREEGDENVIPENEDEDDIRIEDPTDEMGMLKSHIEMQDEELIRQREMITAILKQNEELVKTVKALQESQDTSSNHKTSNSQHEGAHSAKDEQKELKGKGVQNSNLRQAKVTFESRMDPESKPQGLSRKEIQAMIAQQMQIAGGGYAIPPAKNCGHPYPVIYDLEEYPKGYVIPRFRTFSGEGNKDLNPEQHLAHFIASCGNTGGNDALLLRQFPQSLVGTAF